MVIKCCPRCTGRPYTRNYDLVLCPKCGAVLELESIPEQQLSSRARLDEPGSGGADVPGGVTPPGQSAAQRTPQSAPRKPSRHSPQPQADPKPRDPQPPWKPTGSGPVAQPITGTHTAHDNRRVEAALGTTIRGRISQYSSTGSEDGNYRRLLVQRIYDAIVYKQRFENLLHRFTVRVEGGTDAFGNQEYFDVPVNVHGTIAGGMQLADNNEVEVTGTYRGGTLMAREVTIIANGYRTPVQFQRAVGLIALSIAALVALIFGIYVAVDSSNGGSIWPTIVDFLKTWGVVSLILLVLYVMFCVSRFGFQLMLLMRGQRSHPLLTIVLLGFILTVLILAKFGSAGNLLSALSSLGAAILPSAIVLLLMIFLVFRLIFPRR